MPPTVALHLKKSLIFKANNHCIVPLLVENYQWHKGDIFQHLGVLSSPHLKPERLTGICEVLTGTSGVPAEVL